MLRVYKTLIRPHLEYCVQLWNPAAEHGNWSLILRIESIQRRFTRMIEEVGLLPYSERLRILQLTTLAERRSRGDLIEVYKANKGFSQLAGVLNWGGGGGKALTMTMTPWNLTHGQWSKNLTMTTDTLEFPPWSMVKTVIKCSNFVV